MKYQQIISAVFVSRPNRFIAVVTVDGEEHRVHVKNTGRCKELLIPGCIVYLAQSDNPSRKTAYDLVAVQKMRESRPPIIINMDSQAPNSIAAEWLPKSGLFSADAVFKREVSFGNSRFDFYIEDGERRAFLEVKGVTLEQEGIAMFPDAPTQRGIRHINELKRCVGEGYEAYILFVVQMKEIRLVRPNDLTHKQFGDALRAAAHEGVKVLAVDCVVTHDSVTADRVIPVELN